MRLRIAMRQNRLFLTFPLALALLSATAYGRVELQPCRNNIAPAQQIELGNKAAQQVYQQMPVLPDTSPVTRYVSALGHKLAAEAPGYKWPFNFHVVDVADINAFALPGGSIFVNLGTVQAAENEAQLAAVIAHEISHVVLQHSVCNLEKEKRVGIIAGIGQIAAGLALGDGAAGTLAQETIGIGAGLGFLRMSREAEQQADLMGVGILYDAGYDPHAMPQFFQTIEKKYGKGSAQFLSDHPNPGNRLEYVNHEISTFVTKPHQTVDTPQFDNIHRTVAGMHAYTQKEIASGVWKQQAPNQTVSGGVNQVAPAASTGASATASQGWSTFQGNGFSLRVPSDWQVAGNADAAMLAPSGGINATADGHAGNLVYGLLTDTYKAAGGAPLNEEFNGLLDELTRDNPGLQPGRISTVTVAGVTGQSVQAISQSANNGKGEHDLIIAIPVQNTLRYFVFVAPEPDFSRMRPTFERILNSITVR